MTVLTKCAIGLALVGSAEGFSPVGTPARVVTRHASPQMLQSRRDALFAGAAAATTLAATASPAFAAIDEDANEAAMAAIAKKAAAQNAAADAAKKANIKTPEEQQAAQDEAKRNIGIALAGSVVLSVPFYYRNVLRLATKIGSGGEDDGYNTYKEGKKGAKKAKKVVETSKPSLGKSASQFFFKRNFDDQ